VNSGASTILKGGGAALLLAVAVWLGVDQFRASRQANPDTTRIWFYKLSTRELYVTDADTIPPDKANDGGVRAMVVTFDAKSSKSRKIAYLETCSPQLKDLLELIKAARATHHVFDGKIPARGSSFFQGNTLVRRVDDSEWFSINTPEGQKIIGEWLAWRGPHGERPVACVP
jgi:hypothetical protein